MSLESCADSFYTRRFYVVLYDELCVLTCPGCTLPYWEARWKPLAEAVVYERSGEGKPTGPLKALFSDRKKL